MKILLAIDTSPLADETISAVHRMFGSSRPSVVVLCVVGDNERETIPTQAAQMAVAQDLTVLTKDFVHSHEEVAARAAQTLRMMGLTATSEIAYGDPRRVLVEAARSHGADLMVVGCHCHSASHRLLVGDIASHLVSHAPCHVVVVRHVHKASPVAC